MVTDQQTRLLQEKENLLREQKELLQKLNYASKSKYEIYVKNIDRDEIRSGFLVKSCKKKLWNVQINLIKEFDRICKKHDIRWFATCGTLIGAARHGGFVPWDDDVDIVMFRPDFEKFKKVAVSEIKSPYHLDIWYNYRLEIDEFSELTDDSLPLLSRKFHKNRPWAPFHPIIKIRDKRTLLPAFLNHDTYNQGIWIDLFALDSLPPFTKKQQRQNFDYIRTLFMAATHPEMIEYALQKNQRFIIDNDTLRNFMSLPYKQRCMQVEELLAENFFMSEHLGHMRDWCIDQNQRFYHSKDYQEVIYLPFEKIEIPVPVGYDSILTDFYGDWRTLVVYKSHTEIYSADISWDEYLQKKR